MAYYVLTTRPGESSVGLLFARGADLTPFAAEDQVQIGIFRLP
jgi:hypothetical protein